jgi:hypothetical protein
MAAAAADDPNVALARLTRAFEETHEKICSLRSDLDALKKKTDALINDLAQQRDPRPIFLPIRPPSPPHSLIPPPPYPRPQRPDQLLDGRWRPSDGEWEARLREVERRTRPIVPC